MYFLTKSYQKSITKSKESGHYNSLMKHESEKKRFSQRFAELCDDNEIPPDGKGRQRVLAKKWGVSQVTAFKWLRAEAIPETEKCIEIAKGWKVSFEWLMTGRGEKAYRPTPADYSPEILALAKQISELDPDKLTGVYALLNMTPATDARVRENYGLPSEDPVLNVQAPAKKSTHKDRTHK